MTYNEICMALAGADIENNRGEASMLICHFCNINKAELLTRRDEDFDSEELRAAVEKRVSHYPLQYILGFWDFCHETHKTTANKEVMNRIKHNLQLSTEGSVQRQWQKLPILLVFP